MVEELALRARREGYRRLTAFAHDPAFFVRRGFSIVPHTWVPEKIAHDCTACPLFRNCGQYAIVLESNVTSVRERSCSVGRPYDDRRTTADYVRSTWSHRTGGFRAAVCTGIKASGKPDYRDRIDRGDRRGLFPINLPGGAALPCQTTGVHKAGARDVPTAAAPTHVRAEE